MLRKKVLVGERQTASRIVHDVNTIWKEMEIESLQVRTAGGNLPDNVAVNDNYCDNELNLQFRDCACAIQTQVQHSSDIIVSSDEKTDNSVLDVTLDHSENMDCGVSLPNSAESGNDNMLDLRTDLAKWSLQFNISHIAVTNLLHILSPMHPELPLDARTLLHTPRELPLKDLENGQYCHIGIEKQLVRLLPPNFNSTSIDLSISIDGVALFHSTKKSIWPISCMIRSNNCRSNPFAVGIFYGGAKPDAVDTYLQDFVLEMRKLQLDGFVHNNLVIVIKIHSFVCDAPAKAYIKCIKSHGGYAACDRCEEYGEYVSGRVIYEGTGARLRTHTSFLAQEDDQHHVLRSLS